MFVYQNDKLYVQGENKLVGVEIHSDKTLLVEGTETELADEHLILTPHEVQCKFQTHLTPYIFPREVEIKDEPVGTAKRTTRKSTSK